MSLNLKVYTPPAPVAIVAAAAKPAVRSFELAFSQGSKGMRIDAVDPKTGHVIAHLAAIRKDGKLRVYEGLPTDLGLALTEVGGMVTVTKTGQ